MQLQSDWVVAPAGSTSLTTDVSVVGEPGGAVQARTENVGIAQIVCTSVECKIV